jgi:hypothetical protein
VNNELSPFNSQLLLSIAALNPTDEVQLTDRKIAVNLQNGITAAFYVTGKIGEFVTEVHLTSDKYKRMSITIYNTPTKDIAARIAKSLADWHQRMKLKA